MKYLFVKWMETRRVPINRFGKLGYRTYECAGVAKVEDGAKLATLYFAPDRIRPAKLALRNVYESVEFKRWPRKNAKVWKKCYETEAEED